MAQALHLCGNTMSSKLTFFKNFIKEFHYTGAIMPSSEGLSLAITEKLRERNEEKISVLEVGAGTGVFTRKIINHLKQDDELIVYEINDEFTDYLKNSVVKDIDEGIEIKLLNEDIMIEDENDRKYDFIVSGLPFNNFPVEVVEKILSLYMRKLKIGGILSFFEYMYMRNIKLSLPLAKNELIRIKRIDELVNHFNEKFGIGRSSIYKNIPPAFVNYLRR